MLVNHGGLLESNSWKLLGKFLNFFSELTNGFPSYGVRVDECLKILQFSSCFGVKSEKITYDSTRGISPKWLQKNKKVPGAEALAVFVISTARWKNSATFSKSSSVNPLVVKAGVPLIHKRKKTTFSKEDMAEFQGQKVLFSPILIPPGTRAETSPGTVFLLAAIWANSKTLSTLEPSTP